MDATIIEAPSSTKNKEQQRDPEMHQTKKGNQWHFGMKAHIGVDAKSGLTHSLVTTAANEHDLNQVVMFRSNLAAECFGSAMSWRGGCGLAAERPRSWQETNGHQQHRIHESQHPNGAPVSASSSGSFRESQIRLLKTITNWRCYLANLFRDQMMSVGEIQ